MARHPVAEAGASGPCGQANAGKEAHLQSGVEWREVDKSGRRVELRGVEGCGEAWRGVGGED